MNPLDFSSTQLTTTTAPAKILIIEDDQSIAKVLRISLSASGYIVRTAVNGMEGLEQVYTWHPDLITTDVNMPLMSGVELCRRVRAISRTPILIISAERAEDVKVEALDAGANDYVTKPFSMPEVQARIRAILRRVQSRLGPLNQA